MLTMLIVACENTLFHCDNTLQYRGCFQVQWLPGQSSPRLYLLAWIIMIISAGLDNHDDNLLWLQ